MTSRKRSRNFVETSLISVLRSFAISVCGVRKKFDRECGGAGVAGSKLAGSVKRARSVGE